MPTEMAAAVTFVHIAECITGYDACSLKGLTNIFTFDRLSNWPASASYRLQWHAIFLSHSHTSRCAASQRCTKNWNSSCLIPNMSECKITRTVAYETILGLLLSWFWQLTG